MVAALSRHAPAGCARGVSAAARHPNSVLLLEVGLNDSGASMAVYSLFLLVPLACLMSLELPAKQQNQIEMLG